MPFSIVLIQLYHFWGMRGCLKNAIFRYGGVKKWKSWKSSERIGNEINSFTVLVGTLPHIMPCSHCLSNVWMVVWMLNWNSSYNF